MARIHDPIGWLEKNVRPSLIIEVCVQPFGTEHEEEGHNPEISNVTLKGSEAGKIGRVIYDYYKYLRDTFPDVESPRTYRMLTAKKPRRNGGYIWSSVSEEPYESWWWAHRPHQFSIPLGPKDVYRVWEDVHKDRPPAKKRKVAPKKSNPMLKMAAWLEELPPKGLTVMMNFDGGETLRFTSKTWQEMLDVIKGNARAKKMDVAIEGKKSEKLTLLMPPCPKEFGAACHPRM